MKILWKTVNKINISPDSRTGIYLLARTLIYAAAGILFWLASGKNFMPGMAGVLCFAGYPGMLGGVYGGLIYLYRHGFK